MSTDSAIDPTLSTAADASPSSASIEPSAVDAQLVDALISHLRHACPPLLHAHIPPFVSSLSSLDAHSTLTTFLSDPSLFTLLVHRLTPKPSPTDPEPPDSFLFSTSPPSSLPSSLSSTLRATVAFIKHTPTLDPSQPLAAQLYTCSLHSPTLFDTLLSYVRHLFLPFSRTSPSSDDPSKPATSSDATAGDEAVYRGVARKLGELEVELLRFQESIDVPFITLDLHPLVAAFVSAQSRAGRPLRVEEFGPEASDPAFLNEVQRGLNEWKKAILRVTRLSRDANAGTVMQEVNFWAAMERSVLHIYEQKDSPGVELTFQLLRQNKRFLATTGFMQDVGMSEEGKDKDRVVRYAQFLRDMPIKRLLAATDLAEISRALDAVFHHLKQIKRVDYPLARLIALMQALSRDTVMQVHTVLSARHLMSLPSYDEFVQVMQPVDELFGGWPARVGEMNEVIKAIARKKPNESIARLNEPYTEWADMRTRLQDVRRLRKEHEELRVVIGDTLSNDPFVRLNALDAIHSAYAYFTRDIDPLSITSEGRAAFAAALSAYNLKVDRVESELEAKIRQLLDHAKDDSVEMFRVCARFNPLFVRPRIQQAIREYQEQLMSTVKKDIAHLQRQWHDKGAKGEVRVMSALHDVPPLSASLLWSRQLERQLDALMSRVEQVLGKQWHHHLEGKQLKRDSDDFRAKLKPTKLYQAWLTATQEQLPHLQVKGPIYRTLTHNNRLTLAVNFDRRLITLFKEVRNLARLDLKMPFDVLTAADEARQNYPFAMRLEEVLRIYARTCAKLEADERVAQLSAGRKRSMQESIGKGVQLQWLDSQVKSYVDTLGSQAVDFQEQVEEVTEWVDKATGLLTRMDATKVEDGQLVKAHLQELQAVVDHLDKRGYSNLDDFLHWLEAKVEAVVAKRLRTLIEAFVAAVSYDGNPVSAKAERRKVEEEEDNGEVEATGKRLQPSAHFAELIFPTPIKHELLIRQQVLTIDPPLEKARLSLLRVFHAWLSLLLELPRIRLDTLTPMTASSASSSTYRAVISQVEPALLQSCLSAIESQLSFASVYVDSWLQYQALWDLDLDAIVSELGTDLQLWERLLLDMKRARATFDTNEQRRRFGPLLVDFSAVQQKVNNKYDAWHKDVLARFGAMLGELLVSVYSGLRQAREQLEKHSFDFGSTGEIVDSVTLLQGLKVKAEGWKEEVARQQSVEQLLQRQRFHFPSDWLFSERVEGEWKAFEQILQRKLGRMHDEAANIQQKVGYEDLELDRRIKEFQAEWKKSRPVRGDLHHVEVETTLNVTDVNLSKLEVDVERISMAKKALDMPGREEGRLQPIREELTGLKEVWGHLSASWRELDALREKLFREVKPSELRKSLSRLQTDVNRLPNAMRSYEAFDFLRTTIKGHLALNANLVELHSGVLRAKHEKAILKELGLQVSWSELTVGQLWACDMAAHAKAVQAILTAAQGESALEEFLNELREQWESTRFELVDYRGKCCIVRNFEPLFALLTDRLSDVSGMKQSPFFKTFERDALTWEGKMNAAQGILDVMIDVQRKWVYLEAIFTSSADVQQQLQLQYKKFKAFDREFVRLMRDIAKEPHLDVWVKEERRLQAELDAYADTLTAIQKALGEYLEKQRAAFPRFYFVGDEDLLEMIGNAKNPHKVIRHLSKMFAGVEALEVAEGGKRIEGMVSKEGEVVRFVKAVDVDEGSVHAWLREVEYQMRFTLATLLQQSVASMNELDAAGARGGGGAGFADALFTWIERYPAQIVLLSQQVQFSMQVDTALASQSAATSLSGVLTKVEKALDMLAERILLPSLTADSRKKYEQLITEKVHQRDAVRALIDERVQSAASFAWVQQMRYYLTPYQGKLDAGHASTPELNTLEVRIARATFHYGFEYLGVSERLVQTPLTDRAYLTLAEALHMRLGGNPFGPAGTGKTETVKALGGQLGRMTLVFNCDEAFDFNAMGRIFVGLCQCGAWGCFDEFNRLEERILSAVSQQILTIQRGLKDDAHSITLLSKQVRLDPRVGLFVTMNPGYAGRSNLPDNLKQLFRSIAMIQPDKRLIAQVMLYSQGFRSAEELSGKVVLLFGLCSDQLSSRSHYDFGLRALKSVLRSAGGLKRAQLLGQGSAEGGSSQSGKEKDEEKMKQSEDRKEPPASLSASASTTADKEQELLVRSIVSTIVPKLVSGDVSLFSTLVTAVFPTATVTSPSLPTLRSAISSVARELGYVDSPLWTDKLLQLHDISSLHHGVILVGPAGVGKSSAWNTLRMAVERSEGVKVVSYVLDPKAMSKQELFGVMDDVTMEFTDGVFTSLLRRIIDNVRGEAQRQHWIVFDGDVDPEWAENLNSVLDDNKLLTLPNGERLALTNNVRLMFEVASLDHATPATVSRCGMVWFSEEVVDAPMLVRRHLTQLRSEAMVHANLKPTVYSRWRHVQEKCADILAALIGFQSISREAGTGVPPTTAEEGQGFLLAALDWAGHQSHIMPLQASRALMSFFSLFKGAIARVIDYDDNRADFPLTDKQVEAFLARYVVFATLWAFGGSLSLANRIRFCDELLAICPPSLPLPPKTGTLLDWEVRVESQEWEPWEDRVEAVELDAPKVIRADVVIDTVDTARHTDVISSWVADHRPLLLVGPPGSGKSMTLTSVLRSLPEFELVTLNFSSTTTPKLLLDTLNHQCKVQRTPTGLVMSPNNPQRWLVVFCDEINLPANDAYGTQHVITFLRQLSEHGGYWRPSDLSFVRLERVQVLGACNPPTDAGRVPLTPRFLRHCPLVFVDFPAVPSLKAIYGTFNRALLKLVPSLRSYADALTDAMIEVYSRSQQQFTPDKAPHYVYSPRELSRWVRALYEAIKPPESPGGGGSSTAPTLTPTDLVRLWAHEALRLFQDRLIERSEREWTDACIDDVAARHFPSVDLKAALRRPILFSNWLTRHYSSVEQEALREHVKVRLRVFNEEELSIKLVIFDEVLDHILRIDRVLRQPLGHLLLVGTSGAGKTILSKFVAWMNGLSVFQIKVHKYYTGKDFDKDLRSVLIRAGCKGESICFIFDESNVLNTAFLERMNALLAGGEVPGLFEGQDYAALLGECREGARRAGLLLDTEEELYRHFISEVQRRLHVVFTMNPANEDFDNRSATSPALFNRCVIDWFGEWSGEALYQVGYEFTRSLDLGDGVVIDHPEEEDRDEADATSTPASSSAFKRASTTERDAVVSTLVYVHTSVAKANAHLASTSNGRSSYVTPRHYLDFLKHYQSLFTSKRAALEEQQRHLNTGLRKLKETQEEVSKLQDALREKELVLRDNEKRANDKLEQMMVDKREAEAKRDVSLQLAKDIAEQAKEITQRQATVESELSSAKPALEEAEAAVRNIKKTDLDQVSRYPNPPAPVKLALEAVVLMLGERDAARDWEEIRKILRRSDFIKSVINYDAAGLSKKTRDDLTTKYLPEANFQYDVVYNASKACGPLVQWVASTLNFSRIKNSVQPLEEEMRALRDKTVVMERRQEELQRMQAELQQRIDQYKVEYSALIGEVERIKAEMGSVQVKVNRSMSLLSNLTSERERWQQDSDSFQTQLSTVVGDVLLSAAFLSYSGYFNQTYRALLLESWQDELQSQKVNTKTDLSLVEYLSTGSERLEWQANSLPVDDLCTENAIMLTRFNRYPLLIDPSGQATAFLMKQLSSAKILRTSFLDDAFLKHLESALRFGNALLVEDVENIDPILNSVLNREITRTGGRVMITLGDKEIDFSPSFTIFLSTRDPNAFFTPDLCSRVTLVNFTVTHSSLTSQCLNKALSAERPDIDRKRSDLLKLQGEFRVRLRELEDGVLNALAEQKGNILDDETVMLSLEKLKEEAGEVSRKMSESDGVMEEITAIGNLYRPFALACSSVYFALERLADVHFLYHFSLPFFLRIVDDLLNPAKTQLGVDGGDKMQRLQQLTHELFHLTYARVSRGLFNEDQSGFALRLIQIALDEARLFPAPALDNSELEFFMRGTAASKKSSGDGMDGQALQAKLPSNLHVTQVQRMLLAELGRLKAFEGLITHVNGNADAWSRWLTGGATTASSDEGKPDTPDHLPPSGWESGSGARHVVLFRQMLIAKVLRPDHLPALTHAFISSLFSHSLLPSASNLDLASIITNELPPSTPLLLVSKPGFDASSKVDALAAAASPSKYQSFAMGSAEGYDQADAAITAASKAGGWVLLKNVHLSPAWLTQLEKRLHRLTFHPHFRLFLTMELNPSVPSNLIRLSHLVIFEPPVGVKASLQRTFSALPPARVNRAPAERSRLYILLAWLHAVVLERLRYTPVGWAKAFEFSETDALCSMDAIDEWVDRIAQGRLNVSPDKIPWEALRVTLESVMYGGRVDNEFDRTRLAAFIDRLFTPRAFDVGFELADGVVIADVSGYDAWRAWVEELQEETSPAVLGLPSNAEEMLLRKQGEHISSQLLRLQNEARELDVAGHGNFLTEEMQAEKHRHASADAEHADTGSTEQPTWMAPLQAELLSWLKHLPRREQLAEVNLAGRTASNPGLLGNPLFRCIQREHLIYTQLLSTILADLEACKAVFDGSAKASNRVRDILNGLHRGQLPASWKRAYTSLPSLTPPLFIADLVLRLQQVHLLASLDVSKYSTTPIWLGALTAPEALIAATRQLTAQSRSLPLEQLQMQISVGEAEGKRLGDFAFVGLVLHCSRWEGGHLSVGAGVSLWQGLAVVGVSWDMAGSGGVDVTGEGYVSVPVYLNVTREKLLFSVRVPLSEKEKGKAAGAMYLNRGTCLTVWNQV